MRILALVAVLALVAPAVADEVRTERDASGQLHVTITGEPQDGAEHEAGFSTPRSPQAPDLQSNQQEALFSARVSNRRRELARRLKQAEADLAETRRALQAPKPYRSWEIVGPYWRRPDDAAVQRAGEEAYKAGVADAEERQRLHEEERLRQRKVEQIREDFNELSEEVRAYYGKVPPWWRNYVE